MDDDFNDWEPIQAPTLELHFKDPAPPPEPDTVDEGLEMSSADEAEVNSSVASNNGVEPNYHPGPLKRANEIGRILRNGVVYVAARVRCCLGLGFGIWPLGAVGGALLVWFVCARMRKRRARVKDRLIVLVQDKDQKINQLLFQIAHIKEIISARRRVPVLRVS
ncbi:hypothetical protein HRI_004624000 [Hibiscus trionum]|uniref:Transmembrane protein n=1 Tax=Hibiscus trionum TaxID=183268 RepID=A0A9W7MLN9_HIBTR|nr:hypothetical protein HRI_004624000 [Hibiscus trionum]